MSNDQQGRIILALSIPLTALLVIIGCVALLTPGFYSRETLNWQVQSAGQDMIDLFLISPCLLISSALAYRNNKAATMIWGDVVLYLSYTFTIYCFDIHFNKLFVLYCICLGLSFYSFIFFLFTQRGEYIREQLEGKRVVRFTAVYFFVISVVFYFLWLSEIVPAIMRNTTPQSVKDTGLFTNAVQVIDLSVMLPAIFITGIFLLKKRSLGFMLAPVLLSFFILMDVTIGFLVVLMKMKAVGGDLVVAAAMALLALTGLVLLTWYLRSIKN